MKLFSGDDKYKLYLGSMLELSEVIEPKSIDSIVTDPPYGLTSIVKRLGSENSAPIQYGKDGSFQRLSKGFMGKEWDGSGIEYNVNAWRKCYEVLKPGGYLLAFGGSRTFHRIAVAIEDRGFEIRDVIMWLYGSGFPKSLNIGLAIDKKNDVDNRTGNIKTNGKGTDSGSNIYNANNGSSSMAKHYDERIAQNEWSGWGTALKPSYEPIIVARKPVEGSVVDNVIKYGVGGINIEGCRIGDDERTQFSGRSQSKTTVYNSFNQDKAHYETVNGRFPSNTIITYDETDEQEVCGEMQIEETGSASRYFYCAKASQKDRDDGLFELFSTPKRNNHPTVKPTELMQYLVRLVTPSGGTVLDPFNGSGSTGKAVMYENKERGSKYKYIGIDLSDEYLAISKARIEYAEQDNVVQVTKNGDIFEQKSLFEDLEL